MTKIRCGDHTGIDLDQVVAWQKGKLKRSGGEQEFLSLFFAGADNGLYIYQESVGRQAFDYLYKLLLDRFAFDLALAADNNLPS